MKRIIITLLLCTFSMHSMENKKRSLEETSNISASDPEALYDARVLEANKKIRALEFQILDLQCQIQKLKYAFKPTVQVSLTTNACKNEPYHNRSACLNRADRPDDILFDDSRLFSVHFPIPGTGNHALALYRLAITEAKIIADKATVKYSIDREIREECRCCGKYHNEIKWVPMGAPVHCTESMPVDTEYSKEVLVHGTPLMVTLKVLSDRSK